MTDKNNWPAIHVIGESLSDNLGDRLISHAIRCLSNDLGYKCLTYDLSRPALRDPSDGHETRGSGGRLYGIKKYIPEVIVHFAAKLNWLQSNYKRIITSDISTHDIVIFGGGQLLIDNGNFPFYLFMWKLLVNRKTTNICVFGVGANPDYSWSSKYFIKYFLKNINHIYVRDPYSAEVLKKHFQVDPDITHDAAYYMNHSSKPELNDQRIGVGIVCKSVYDYYNSPLSVSEYYRLYEKALSEFQKKEICLIYSTPEDRRECLKFQKYYNKCHNRNIPIIENDTVEELLSNIGSLSTIVAGRMHLLIAGQLSNTTVIPVEISNKIRVYNDLKNQESVKTKRNIVTNDFTKLISDLRNLINDDN